VARLVLLLAACAVATPLAAMELGTLFHTPEERARLDRLRRGEATAPAQAVVPGESRPPRVTGYVRRSDGRNTVWVDGAPLATRNDPRVFDPRSVAPPAAPPPDGAASPPAPAQPEAPALPAAPGAKAPRSGKS
jgi:hypothetical protein